MICSTVSSGVCADESIHSPIRGDAEGTAADELRVLDERGSDHDVLHDDGEPGVEVGVCNRSAEAVPQL